MGLFRRVDERMTEVAAEAESSLAGPLKERGDVLLAWCPAGDLSDGDIFCRIGVGSHHFAIVYPDTGGRHLLARSEYEFEYDTRPPRTFKDFPRKGLNFILCLRAKNDSSKGQFFRAHEDAHGFTWEFLRKSGAVEAEIQ